MRTSIIVKPVSIFHNTMQKNIKHLAVIMDGNRRWAKNRGLETFEGHRAGSTALKNLVKLAFKYKIKYLTAYAFSTENWKRSAIEKNFIFKLLKEVAFKELEELVENNVKVKFIGDLSIFDSDVKNAITTLEDKTSKNDGVNLQVALNYGSVNEFAHAIKSLSETTTEGELSKITEADFTEHLYTKGIPDPEILVRTGGQARLSNYLLWQSTNSHLYFTDCLWPDFGEEELNKALEANCQAIS